MLQPLAYAVGDMTLQPGGASGVSDRLPHPTGVESGPTGWIDLEQGELCACGFHGIAGLRTRPRRTASVVRERRIGFNARHYEAYVRNQGNDDKMTIEHLAGRGRLMPIFNWSSVSHSPTSFGRVGIQNIVFEDNVVFPPVLPGDFHIWFNRSHRQGLPGSLNRQAQGSPRFAVFLDRFISSTRGRRQGG
ncbi:hypothetical protein L209DRAFT_777409 [Thermothelomyces heterothallicus CBS 203.75]